MAEELGKIEKPEAAAFSGKRKLYIVPLIYRWPEADKEYIALFDRYWRDIANQLKHLSDRIGTVKHVFHEGIDEKGEAAMTSLERFNPSSAGIARTMISSGADFVSIEDRELIAESLDWERFIMLGFASEKVAKMATDQFRNAMKKRYDLIVQRIDETLSADEAGVLFIREGHPIQFPKEIEVFSVFPPSLDEIHRYLRNRQPEAAEQEETEDIAGAEATAAESASDVGETPVADKTPAGDETGN